MNEDVVCTHQSSDERSVLEGINFLSVGSLALLGRSFAAVGIMIHEPL